MPTLSEDQNMFVLKNCTIEFDKIIIELELITKWLMLGYSTE